MSTSLLSRIRVISPWLLCVAMLLPGVTGGAQPSVPIAPRRAAASPAPAAQAPLAQLGDDGPTSHTAYARSGPHVAMIDFESSTLVVDQLKAISQALYARLDALPGVLLLPRGATRRWLIRNDLFPFTPYTRPVPGERVTSALKADYLITGHLDKIDGVFNLDVSLFSNREGRYILKDAKLKRDDLDALLQCFSLLSLSLYRAIQENEAAPAGTVITAPLMPEKTPAPEPVKPKGGSTKKNGRKTTAPRTTERPAEPRPAEETPLTPRGAGTPQNDEQIFRPGAGRTPTPEATPEATPRITPRMTPRATPSPAATPAPSVTATPRPTPAPTTTARPSVTPGATAEPTAAAQARELYQEALKPGTPASERIQKLAEAVALAPAVGDYQQHLAMEYYNNGNYASCIGQCDKAIPSVDPADGEKISMLWTIKGSALIELTQYDQAAQAQEKALQVNPKNFWASYNLALALTMAKSSRAAAAWNNFITMADNDPDQAGLVQRARQYLAGISAAPPSAPAPTVSPTPDAKAGAAAKATAPAEPAPTAKTTRKAKSGKE